MSFYWIECLVGLSAMNDMATVPTLKSYQSCQQYNTVVQQDKDYILVELVGRLEEKKNNKEHNNSYFDGNASSTSRIDVSIIL
jgi:hypothetical protein